jgi:hypothetical protein
MVHLRIGESCTISEYGNTRVRGRGEWKRSDSALSRAPYQDVIGELPSALAVSRVLWGCRRKCAESCEMELVLCVSKPSNLQVLLFSGSVCSSHPTS